MAEALADLELPEALRRALEDRYLIERPLGQGGMATVWLARDLRHGRAVALKIMKPGLSETLGAERFLREIQIVARLTHPHILPLLDSGTAAGMLYYVMPRVSGESLRARLKREIQLPVEEALDIAGTVAAALTAAHAEGVVHRDIKPENILFEDGNPIVVDFGIARAVSLAGGDSLTATGLAIGTPAYMSPEQGSGETNVDGRSDIYSLACVLYEMLTGSPPFAGATVQALMARHRQDPVPPLRTVRAAIPPGVEAAVLRALAKTPADRFATPAAFVEALTRPSAPAPKRRRRLLLGGAALAAIAAAVLLLRPGRSAAPPHQVRIAVLPYENLGRPEDAYFADGLADDIRNRLSGLPGVVVIGRLSVSRYRNNPPTPQQIGRELHVEYVLGGTVQSDRALGDSARWKVSSELQRTSDGATVMGGPEEGVFADVFAMEADVSEKVLAKLNITLGEPERQARRAAPTHNVEAHKEYMLGQSQWGKRTPEGIESAIRHYQVAVSLDSSFVTAWVALAEAWRAYPNFWNRTDSTRNLAPSADSSYANAGYAVRRALALDSTLLEPQVVSAILDFRKTRDVRAGIARFQDILRKDPDLVPARKGLRGVFAAANRVEEALAESRRAVDLDPLEPISTTFLAVDLAAARHTKEAMQQLRQVIEVSPNFPQAYMILGTLLWQSGQQVAGADSIGRFLQLREYPRAGDSVVVAALTGRGPTPKAIAVLEGFVRRDWEPEIRLGGILALLGAQAQALQVLEAANARRLDEIRFQRYQPFFNPLRGLPRYEALWKEFDQR